MKPWIVLGPEGEREEFDSEAAALYALEERLHDERDVAARGGRWSEDMEEWCLVRVLAWVVETSCVPQDQCAHCGCSHEYHGTEDGPCHSWEQTIDEHVEYEIVEVPSVLNALRDWTHEHEHGQALCPGLRADTYDEGLRAAQEQVRTILDKEGL